MENLELYEKARSVPAEARKPITAGRLKGMTDISPMWRIKRLTELFGPCGIGWWYIIKDQRTMPGNGQNVCAFVDIDLYYKLGEEVSHPIPGTGGSTFVAEERNGVHTSDECFKMALTDAISVAAKALGVGADVYWDKDRDKYDTVDDAPPKPVPRPGDQQLRYICEDCKQEIKDGMKGRAIWPAFDIAKTSKEEFGRQLCIDCAKAEYKRRNAGTQANAQQTPPPTPPRAEPKGNDPLATYCERCGCEILPTTVGSHLLSVPEIVRKSKKDWGLELCVACQDAEQRAMEAYANREDGEIA